MRIKISSTGDNCILVDGKNTCTSPVPKTFSLEGDSITASIQPATKVAGTSRIIIQICSLVAPDACGTKQEVLFIAPGKIKTFTIQTPYSRIVRDSTIPFFIYAFDQFNNPVSQTTDSFIMEVSTGTINNLT